MTCRVAIRVPSEAKLEGRETQITEMKTLLEKSKGQVARSQALISDIGQRLEPRATA